MTEETKKQEETENLNTKNEIIADDSVTESEGNIEQEGTIANLSIEELIKKMQELSSNENPLSISKKVEGLRSVFYQKLKQIQKEESSEQIEGEGETERTTLHPLEIKFRKNYSQYKRVKSACRKEKNKNEQENLLIKQQIIKDIDALAKEEESIKTTFEKFRTLQNKWRSTGHIPLSESNNLWQSYHHHVELFYDFIKINRELRDLDFKRNLEEKISICKKAEALLNEKSLNTMHEKLQELHEHWKNIGPVDREKRDEIWDRFQITTKIIHKKRNDYFLQKKDSNDKKLEQKDSICKAIDELATKGAVSHQGWQNLIVQCKELEERWKVIGRLGKKENSVAWKTLRSCLNNFYNAKNDFYKNKKQNTAKVIAAKTAICEKAEALKDSTDWKETSQKLIKLQKDWKGSGFMPKHISDKLWKRFRTACDTFFNTRKNHFNDLDNAKENNLKTKKNLLKEVKEFSPSEDGRADFKTLGEFTKKWKVSGQVPFKKQAIEKEFEKLMNKHYDAVKLEKQEISKEKFKNKITAINGNESLLNKEKEFIKTKIDDALETINQYENNLSFFGNSKSNDSIIKEVQKKIDSTQNQVVELKEKLKIIAQH